MTLFKNCLVLLVSALLISITVPAGGVPVAASIDAALSSEGASQLLVKRVIAAEALGAEKIEEEKRDGHHHHHQQAHRKHHGHHQQHHGGHSRYKHLADKQEKGDSKLARVGSGLSHKVFKGACPHPNADQDHPNGAIDFLTCGISKHDPQSKWTPPPVQLQDIKVISSDEAAQSPVFRPCAPYKAAFDRISHKTGVPAVLLMSFALQESGCQAQQTGPNGEFGLMQITPEKCGGAPNGDCKDVDFNIYKGATYFKSQLDGQCNGNVLCAAGTYNGWSAGSTSFKSATNKQYGCASQNNLDYLNSLFNGFCQGKDGYSNEFVKFGNLRECGN